MKNLPVFAMRHRFVLPGCESTIHLARENSFRRLDEAYSAGREVFVATLGHTGELARIGVVARIVTFGRIPAPRGVEGTEDRALLRGLYRARIGSSFPASTRTADVEPLPDSAGELPHAVENTHFEATLAALRRRHRSSAARAAEIDALEDRITRLYRLAVEEQLRTSARQALLEADGLLRKRHILLAAFHDDEDALLLESRILAR